MLERETVEEARALAQTREAMNEADIFPDMPYFPLGAKDLLRLCDDWLAMRDDATRWRSLCRLADAKPFGMGDEMRMALSLAMNSMDIEMAIAAAGNSRREGT
jgi:hypothetical protein